MMDPSVHHATGRLQATSDLPCDDDDTVVTPNRGESSKSTVKSSVEITLRFRFVPSQNNDNIHPAILHANWMHEAITAFGSDKIQFFDNRNRQVSKIEPLRIDPEMHVQQFHLHFDRHTRQHRNTTYTNNSQDHKSVSTYIVHRIRSVVSLSELKATNSIFKLMKEHNFYVNEHRWSETDWETTQLGFIYGLDPQFYDIDQATTKFTNTLRQALPRMKIPKFRLVYCSPKIKTAKGRIVRTKAYAVETLRADRDELSKQLKEAYKESGTFVPFQMRSRHPDAFERFIKAQTRTLATNYVIVLNHIGQDAMHYLSERIIATSGVISLLPCRSVNEDGKYKVLVHQKNYHQVREVLKEAIPKWYEEHVEPDAKVSADRYPGPPAVSPIESDGISQGDHSYLTISINTAMSIGSNISNESPPTFIYRKEQQSVTDESTLGGSQANSSYVGKASWADKVRGSQTYSSSEQPSTIESEQHKLLQQELAKSRDEVAALRERLAMIEGKQAQDQATIEEKVQSQVSQALQEQFRVFTHDMTTMFSQMMMAQMSSNTSKRRATQIDEPDDDDIKKVQSNHIEGAKRWDNKATPRKTSESRVENEDQRMCMTPTKLAAQMIDHQDGLWNDKSSSAQINKQNNGIAKNKEGEQDNKSDSGENDFIKQGSGIESSNKSSASETFMDTEAHDNHND